MGWGWCRADDDGLSVVLDGANLLLAEDSPQFATLERAMDAAVSLVGDCLGHTVIDRSLLRRCSATTTRKLRRAEGDGLLTVAPDADPVMLGMVEDRDVLVVSADKFRGWQRVFPFLAGNARNFLEPVLAPDGTVDLRPRRLPSLREEEVSGYEERDALKAGRIRNDEGALTTVLVCETTECVAARKPAGTALPLRLHDGALVCLECREPMRHLGPRTPAVGLVLSGAGGEARVWLPYGEQLMLGRAAVIGELQIGDLGGPALSRKHALLTADEQGIRVKDLASSNGTFLVTPNRKRTPTPPGAWRGIGPRDAVDLGGSLMVRRSGRLHPFDFDEVANRQAARDIGSRDITERQP